MATIAAPSAQSAPSLPPALLNAGTYLPLSPTELSLNTSACRVLTSTSAAPGSIFVSCLCAGCTVRPLDLLHRDGGTVLSLDRWIEHVSGVACGAGDLATALDIVAVRQQQATGGAASLVPLRSWLRAASAHMGGAGLMRRQVSIYWFSIDSDDNDPGLPPPPSQRQTAAAGPKQPAGAWRAASVVSYDPNTTVWTIKYHTAERTDAHQTVDAGAGTAPHPPVDSGLASAPEGSGPGPNQQLLALLPCFAQSAPAVVGATASAGNAGALGPGSATTSAAAVGNEAAGAAHVVGVGALGLDGSSADAATTGAGAGGHSAAGVYAPPQQQQTGAFTYNAQQPAGSAAAIWPGPLMVHQLPQQSVPPPPSLQQLQRQPSTASVMSVPDVPMPPAVRPRTSSHTSGPGMAGSGGGGILRTASYSVISGATAAATTAQDMAQQASMATGGVSSGPSASAVSSGGLGAGPGVLALGFGGRRASSLLATPSDAGRNVGIAVAAEMGSGSGGTPGPGVLMTSSWARDAASTAAAAAAAATSAANAALHFSSRGVTTAAAGGSSDAPPAVGAAGGMQPRSNPLTNALISYDIREPAAMTQQDLEAAAAAARWSAPVGDLAPDAMDSAAAGHTTGASALATGGSGFGSRVLSFCGDGGGVRGRGNWQVQNLRQLALNTATGAQVAVARDADGRAVYSNRAGAGAGAAAGTDAEDVLGSLMMMGDSDSDEEADELLAQLLQQHPLDDIPAGLSQHQQLQSLTADAAGAGDGGDASMHQGIGQSLLAGRGAAAGGGTYAIPGGNGCAPSTTNEPRVGLTRVGPPRSVSCGAAVVGSGGGGSGQGGLGVGMPLGTTDEEDLVDEEGNRDDTSPQQEEGSVGKRARPPPAAAAATEPTAPTAPVARSGGGSQQVAGLLLQPRPFLAAFAPPPMGLLAMGLGLGLPSPLPDRDVHTAPPSVMDWEGVMPSELNVASGGGTAAPPSTAYTAAARPLLYGGASGSGSVLIGMSASVAGSSSAASAAAANAAALQSESGAASTGRSSLLISSSAPGSVFVSCLCAGCTVRPLDRLHRDGGTVLSLDRWIEHVSGVACGAGDLATALDIVAVRQQQATEVAPLVPLRSWLRAASAHMGGAGLMRRQVSIYWFSIDSDDNDPGLPPPPSQRQTAAAATAAAGPKQPAGAWRAASVVSYDPNTTVWTIKYHTVPVVPQQDVLLLPPHAASMSGIPPGGPAAAAGGSSPPWVVAASAAPPSAAAPPPFLPGQIVAFDGSSSWAAAAGAVPPAAAPPPLEQQTTFGELGGGDGASSSAPQSGQQGFAQAHNFAALPAFAQSSPALLVSTAAPATAAGAGTPCGPVSSWDAEIGLDALHLLGPTCTGAHSGHGSWQREEARAFARAAAGGVAGTASAIGTTATTPAAEGAQPSGPTAEHSRIHQQGADAAAPPSWGGRAYGAAGLAGTTSASTASAAAIGGSSSMLLGEESTGNLYRIQSLEHMPAVLQTLNSHTSAPLPALPQHSSSQGTSSFPAMLPRAAVQQGGGGGGGGGRRRVPGAAAVQQGGGAHG
eukprot:XP_001691890.1 predicted protein [Chlamydomonas reinhardtii]